MKPVSLMNLINSFHKLPGISKKQAEKLSYNLVLKNPELLNELILSLEEAIKNIHQCFICGHLSEKDICEICSDNNRDLILVIVESSLDIFKFEESFPFKPYYHVLGGLINISKEIEFQDLNIKNLYERSKKYREIILALSPNLEGIVTSNYVSRMLPGMKITQLAQGIPLGAAMEYVDEITLKAALDNRKDFK